MDTRPTFPNMERMNALANVARSDRVSGLAQRSAGLSTDDVLVVIGKPVSVDMLGAKCAAQGCLVARKSGVLTQETVLMPPGIAKGDVLTIEANSIGSVSVGAGNVYDQWIARKK